MIWTLENFQMTRSRKRNGKLSNGKFWQKNRETPLTKTYSVPYAILQLLEELFSRPWLSLESPRFHRSLDIMSRCPHKNFSALRPKKWAFETEQQSPPSSLAGGRRATEQNLRCSLGIERNMKPVSKEIQVWFSPFCINLSSDLHKSDCYSLKSERKKFWQLLYISASVEVVRFFLRSLFRL